MPIVDVSMHSRQKQEKGMVTSQEPSLNQDPVRLWKQARGDVDDDG
jgi:hypothetical protein